MSASPKQAATTIQKIIRSYLTRQRQKSTHSFAQFLATFHSIDKNGPLYLTASIEPSVSPIPNFFLATTVIPPLNPQISLNKDDFAKSAFEENQKTSRQACEKLNKTQSHILVKSVLVALPTRPIRKALVRTQSNPSVKKVPTHIKILSLDSTKGKSFSRTRLKFTENKGKVSTAMKQYLKNRNQSISYGLLKPILRPWPDRIPRDQAMCMNSRLKPLTKPIG